MKEENQKKRPRKEDSPARLRAAVARCMARDVPVFSRELSRLLQKDLRDPETKAALARLSGRIAGSRKLVGRRRALVPDLLFPENLPISAKAPEIIRAVSENRVVVVTGATGSGKTTQIPKMCLAAGRGLTGVIGCTQPRRVAALSVARRMAEELSDDTGDLVGVKIRFSKKGAEEPLIKVMTDGILLSETQTDPLLSFYDTVIVDEAHERSLNIDFILGILKNLLSRRRDLRVIITSATIDTEKFSRAFGNAPIIEVSGRMYPVSVRYRPLSAGTGDGDEGDHVSAAVSAVEEILSSGRPGGDVLVFMPTGNDIMEACDALAGKNLRHATILPLYARLTEAEQARAFAPVSGTKIIVSTNVAETSLTIPGIRYVVDTGLARISLYNPRTRANSLPVKKISQASAEQRKGRCGRVADGVCIRLYEEDDFLERPEFTPPEILRANLAEVILRMLALRLPDPARFPFVDSPPPRAVADGYAVLAELSATRPREDGEGVVLTETGRVMARLPLDPRISRILLSAHREKCLDHAAVVAAALSVVDPRQRPLSEETLADACHRRFFDPVSDFVTILNLFSACFFEGSRQRSNSEIRRFCKENYLSFIRVREWREVLSQIRSILHEEGFLGEEPFSALDLMDADLYASLHRSICSGYLSQVALQKEKNVYTAARGREAVIFPGSSLYNRGGKWIVAAELYETSRLFARTAAAIDPAWLEDLAGDLVKKSYSHPRFDKSRSEVVADCRLSLYGLPIVEGRVVPYGPVNPQEASEIFFQQALVEGEAKEVLGFALHNRKVKEEALDMEERLRRRDLYAGDGALCSFYRERLGEVASVSSLRKILRERGGEAFLRASLADVLAQFPDAETLSLFPSRIKIAGRNFPVRYRFTPSEERDGASVRIPAGLVSCALANELVWAIPGLLPERISALIRALPKRLRVAFVPAATAVERLAAEMSGKSHRAPFLAELSRAAKKLYGVDVPESAWPVSAIPPHLLPRLCALGPDGKVLDADRDVARLSARVEADRENAARDLIAAARERFEKRNLTAWTFGDLPEAVPLSGNPDMGPFAYPAISPAKSGSGADLLLFISRDAAAARHPMGLAALFEAANARDCSQIKKALLLPPARKGPSLPLLDPGEVSVSLFRALLSGLLKNVRTQKDFSEKSRLAVSFLLPRAVESKQSASAVLGAMQALAAELGALFLRAGANRVLQEILAEIRSEARALAPGSFPELYPEEHFADLARYLNALSVRARRAAENPERDRQKKAKTAPFDTELVRLAGELSKKPSEEKVRAVTELFFLVQEYKVSVFAQEMGTRVPVSEKRLAAALEAVNELVPSPE
ncbi:MAG: ATP-dependent RNA helicase HrpA [Thermodesulfobacteriota bacterium]